MGKGQFGEPSVPGYYLFWDKWKGTGEISIRTIQINTTQGVPSGSGKISFLDIC